VQGPRRSSQPRERVLRDQRTTSRSFLALSRALKSSVLCPVLLGPTAKRIGRQRSRPTQARTRRGGQQLKGTYEEATMNYQHASEADGTAKTRNLLAEASEELERLEIEASQATRRLTAGRLKD
jgi:hypothetical protein